MNKKILIVIIFVLVLLGGGVGAYLLMGSKSTTPGSQEAVSSSESSAQKSLKDLIGLGQSQECSFSMDEGSSGSVYVASGKMRGDFTTTSDSQTTLSHVLVDGQTSYLWMDGQNTGFKFTIDAADQPDGQSGQEGQANVNLDEKVDYSCKPWIADSSVFALPQGVEFSDMSQFTSPTGTQDTDSKSAQCSACDSAPEDAQAQCRAALGCN